MRRKFTKGWQGDVPIGAISLVEGLNPESRTEERYIKELLDAIVADGGILVDLLINEDGQLVDGYRRYTCAIKLGYEFVPVKVLSGDPVGLWTKLNGVVLAMTGKHWMHMAAQGAEIRKKSMRGCIDSLRKWGGDDLILFLNQNKISASIERGTHRILNYVEDSSVTFADKAVRWQVNHKMQRSIRNLIEQGACPPGVVKAAIEQDMDIWQVKL